MASGILWEVLIMDPLRFSVAGAVVFLLATGCELKISEYEMHFRYDHRGDALDLLLIYKGITVSRDDPETLKKAVATSREFLAGKRRFVVFFGTPWEFDLDGAARDLSGDERARILEALGGWKLQGCGSFLDEARRLSAWQLFRVEGCSRTVKVLNNLLSKAVLESIRGGEFARDSTTLDERDRELWRKRAEGGGPWLWLDGPELVFDVPLGAAGYERLQRQLVEGALRKGIEEFERELKAEACWNFFLVQVLAQTRRFEVGEDRVVLRLRGADGVIRWRSLQPAARYDSRLLDALRKEGIAPDEATRIEDVRGKLPPSVPAPVAPAGAERSG